MLLEFKYTKRSDVVANPSQVGTQGPCVRRYAMGGTQRVACPSGHANPIGVQRGNTETDARAVRPYKQHPSHTVIFHTVSMGPMTSTSSTSSMESMKSMESMVGTQGPCVRCYAMGGTQQVA